MLTRYIFVDFFRLESLIFGDETGTRHHFAVRNAHFWRRDRNSLPF
ncbi:hypothetical protein [Caldifermentibacillus hisashii]|nr:hypothetical protein [Caldifermentibacillus hisashii]MBU5340573.1 hypothetical protein [Caldifermentibacillus hisashii]MEC5273822.1 hypothetical protein [Caldifermentibacillus hisashii]